ncbi:MAG: hypothetical protein JNK94_03880 [Hyphomonadaceae bacterium]|nr:hypothetical protein [Hyphomonadaceae bacterium]
MGLPAGLQGWERGAHFRESDEGVRMTTLSDLIQIVNAPEAERHWRLVELAVPSAAATIAGAVAARTWAALPHRRLWKFGARDPVTFALATSDVKDTGDYMRAMTGSGQVRALSHINASLSLAYGAREDRHVFLSAELEMKQELLHHHLLLLGGAKNNRWTAQCVEDLYPVTNFRFVEDLNTMELDGKLYNSKADREKAKADQQQTTPATRPFEKRIDRDYCVVIAAPNPYNPEKRVMVFAGAHTYGTEGSATLFTRTLRRRWRQPRNFIAFAEFGVSQGGLYGCKLIAYRTLPKLKTS